MTTKTVAFNEIDDRELVKQAAAGSREAFGELVSRHHRLVRSMLWRVLGDEAEVDEWHEDDLGVNRNVSDALGFREVLASRKIFGSASEEEDTLRKK